MPFSDVLKDYENQIKAHDAPAQSGTNALVTLATGIVGEFKGMREKSIAEQAAREMSDLDEKLSAGVAGGSISLSEKLQRLSTKQKEITANFPSAAALARETIKESMGYLPTAKMSEEVLSEGEMQKKLRENILNAAGVAGLAVRKANGDYDVDRSIANYESVLYADRVAKAKKGGNTEEARNEESRAEMDFLGAAYNANVLPSLQAIQDIGAKTRGKDPLVFDAGQALFNNKEVGFMDLLETRVQGMLPQDAKAVREHYTALFDMKRKVLFEGNQASFNRRLQYTTKIMENSKADAQENFSDIAALQEMLGPMAPLYMATSLDQEAATAFKDQILRHSTGTKRRRTMNDTVDAMSGTSDPKRLPTDRKAAVANTLTRSIKECNKVPADEMEAQDLTTYAGAVGACADLVGNSGSPSDIDQMVRNLDSNIVYSRLESAIKMGIEGSVPAKAALNNMAVASQKNLQDQSKKPVAGGLAEILFNPSSGVFEVENIKGAYDAYVTKHMGTAVNGDAFGMQRRIVEQGIRQKFAGVKDTVDQMNRALNMATKTRLIESGGGLKEGDVRQYLIDGMGFKTSPKYRKRPVPDAVPEALGNTIEDPTEAFQKAQRDAINGGAATGNMKQEDVDRAK